MEQDLRLSNAEYRLMQILWAHAPIASPALCRLCEQQLGWKRTTTYTVLKRLSERDIVKNENTIVTPLLAKEDAQKHESRAVMERAFDGSLPTFIAAFLGDETLTPAQAQEIQALIDAYTREG